MSITAAPVRRAAPPVTRDGVFDGLRGLCAVGVIIFHVAYQAGVSNHNAENGFGFWGFLTEGLAVALPPFFVLSGVLLYRSYARGTILGTPVPRLGRFLGRRALRILPAYVVLVTVSILLFNLSGERSVWELVKPYLLLHFITTPDAGDWLVGLEPTWTVVAEMTFYALLPLAALWFDRRARAGATPADRARRLMGPLAVVIAVGLGWTGLAYLPVLGTLTWYFAFWPVAYMGFFAAGMMLAVAAARHEAGAPDPRWWTFVARHGNVAWLAAALVFAVNVPQLLGIPGDGTWGGTLQELVSHVCLMLFSVLVIVPLVVPGGRTALMTAVLGNPLSRALGRISYGLYLWHVLLIHAWFGNGSVFGVVPQSSEAFRGQVGFWVLLAFVLGGSIVLAVVTLVAVERPALRLLPAVPDGPARARSSAGDEARTPVAPG